MNIRQDAMTKNLFLTSLREPRRLPARARVSRKVCTQLSFRCNPLAAIAPAEIICLQNAAPSLRLFAACVDVCDTPGFQLQKITRECYCGCEYFR
jgi:hypothetical protein